MNNTPMLNLVQRVSRRRRLSAVLRAFLLNTIIFVGVIVLMVGVDALFGLSRIGLIILDVGIVGTAAWYLVTLIKVYRDNRFTPMQTAAFIEEKVDPSYNPLVNALSLLEVQPEGCSPQLLEHAIGQGGEYASSVNADTVIDWRPCQVLAGWLGATLLCLLLSFVIVPDLFMAVGLRMMHPTEDHPPFTRMKYAVNIEPNPVVYGDHVDMTIDVRGPGLLDSATISVKGTNGSLQTLPLLPRLSDEDSEELRSFVHNFYNVQDPITFFVSMGESRSRWYEVNVKKVPKFRDMQINYTYPAYTRWKPTKTNLDDNTISALTGTDVTVTAMSNLPLSKAILTVTDGDKETTVIMTVDPDHPESAKGTFTVARNATYKVELVGEDGTEGDAPRTGKVVAVQDQKPSCSIAQPEPHLMVPPNWPVPVQVNASDDIGVHQIDLHLSINSWGPFSRTLVTFEEDQRHASAHLELDMKTLGVNEGDVITLYATAFDSRPPTPGFSDSERCVIQIISLEEYEELARQRYRIEEIQKEWERLTEDLETLAEQRQEILDEMKALEDKLKKDGKLGDADQQRLEELAEKLDAYNDNLSTLTEGLKERMAQKNLYEFESGYKDALGMLAEQLAAQSGNAQALQSLAENPNRSPEDLAKAMREFRENDKPFTKQEQQQQQDIEQDLEKLQMANQLQGQAARLQMIIEQQRELAKQLEAITDKENPSVFDKTRMKKIAEEQDALRDELKDVTQALADLGEEAKDLLPKMSASARQLAEALEEMDVPSDQAQCSQTARKPDARESLAAAEKAAEKLESLLGSCQGMNQNGVPDLDGCLSLSKPQIPSAMNQMMQGLNPAGMGSKSSGGYGGNGARGRVAMAGPVVGMNGGLYSDKTGRGRALRRKMTKDGEGDDYDVESINPEHVRKYSGGKVIYKGVPIRYQREVSAYFKRIADEQKQLKHKKEGE